MIRYADVQVGAELPAQSFPVRRVNLIRYAGASGDFNEIHWNERFATRVGLPDVIAHGMFTMAAAARVVTDWLDDPTALVDYSVRFTKPVVVPDDGVGALIEVTAKVGALLDDNRARIDIVASSAGHKVLGKAQAVVRLG